MLTEKLIRDARSNGKARTIWDRQVTGLGLQITPAGKKNYVIRYPVEGRWRQRILCRAGQISLEEVRRLAAEVQLRVRAGESDPLRNGRDLRTEPTVAQGVERYFSVYAPSQIRINNLTERTVRDYRKQALRHIVPVLGELRISDVTRQDVERLAASMEGSPVQRNRVLALLSRLFNLFERWELRPQHTNPARGIERSREEERDRVLSAEEIGSLSRALNLVQENSLTLAAAIRFTAITGLRIGEVLAIRWADVDFRNGRLVLPKTKTGRRTHDLPAPALEVLRELPRLNDWPFTMGRGAPMTYKTVRKGFARLCAEAGLEDLRIHDLRRTVMTMAARSGVGTHALRDLLGHKSTAMADRYIRSLGVPVREAREQVGAEVVALMEAGAKTAGEETPIPVEC